MTVNSVERVKGLVEGCVGQKVRFKVKKGKTRSHMSEGIIADTYPSVFTVYIDSKGVRRIVSFNYIDIITNYVEFFICNEEETRIV